MKILFSALMLTLSHFALAQEPISQSYKDIESILSYYNGDSYAHQGESGNERTGLYGEEKEDRFTPTAVENGFTDGQVKTFTVNLTKEGGILAYIRKLEKKAEKRVLMLPNEAASYDQLQFISRFGDDQHAVMKKYLLASVREVDAKKLAPLLYPNLGNLKPNPVKFAQVIVYDIGSEVIGAEYMVLYNYDYSWAIVIQWTYTHS